MLSKDKCDKLFTDVDKFINDSEKKLIRYENNLKHYNLEKDKRTERCSSNPEQPPTTQPVASQIEPTIDHIKYNALTPELQEKYCVSSQEYIDVGDSYTYMDRSKKYRLIDVKEPLTRDGNCFDYTEIPYSRGGGQSAATKSAATGSAAEKVSKRSAAEKPANPRNQKDVLSEENPVVKPDFIHCKIKSRIFTYS